MTRRRWIADEVSGDHAVLVGEHADHLVRVLRARIGQEFDIALGGSTRKGRIQSLAPDRVEFSLGQEVYYSPQPDLTLLLAIFKFDRMEWAVEKCTELGVSRIVPTISRRTDSHLARASIKRVERWRRIALQAAEQSRRSAPIEIAEPAELSQSLNFPATLRIVLAETEEQTSLRDALLPDPTNRIAERDSFALAVGPEGGWTEEEVSSFRKSGWVSVTLGNTILRAETAAITATAILFSSL